MITEILEALVDFRTNAGAPEFERVFGPALGDHLFGEYCTRCKFDLVAFYARLDPTNRILFQAHLAAQLPPAAFDSPRCVECGGELTSEDIEAGEDVCLDCAAALLAGEIEHEPGSLLATVRVRLGEEE